MIKNFLKNTSGSILLETLLSINIFIIIMISFSVIFLSMLHNYLKNLYALELRSQMKFAAECIIQDIKYADSINIYTKDGHDIINITTHAANDSSHSLTHIIYRQDDLAYYPRILKNDNPLTGDNIFCSTYIRFTCRPLSPSSENCTYLLDIKGSEQTHATKYFYLKTAVVMLGKRKLN
ncbi:hypothetical protein [Pectinatus sottacetonis]|uniref:hypothetical protein n=1 Tax=Pectinatus sottacetonis TaxID=1002795 RepID=UPI0018C7F100|nr:hypothetical protein [Pectinatus sottacetonis]